MSSQHEAIKALRTFAINHNAIEFVNLCTAALQGEEWAVERSLEVRLRSPGMSPKRGDWARVMMAVIRATNCTRPNGAVPCSPMSP